MVSIQKFRIFVLVLNQIEYWSNYSIRFEISNIRTALMLIELNQFTALQTQMRLRLTDARCEMAIMTWD